MTNNDNPAAPVTVTQADRKAAAAFPVPATPVQGDVERVAQCQVPGCETLTSDGVCGPCDERVTEQARNLHRTDALKSIANPPTMNGFQELALWMQQTAAEALK